MTDSLCNDIHPYQLNYAEIDWGENDTPCAKNYGDIYYCPTQGLQETQYVFLQHNRLAERWQALNHRNARQFSIAEAGFGTGLNFLATWKLWQHQGPKNWQLHFVSAEKHPLQPEDLQRSLRQWPELSPWANQLIAAYPTLIPGHHLIKFAQGQINLHLLLGDATQCFEQLRATSHPTLAAGSGHKFDAWFLDGFAPSKNPQLWNDSLYTVMAQLSQPGTTVATFTSAGNVRRGLIQHGFQMEKVPGFNHKREMLQGIFKATSNNSMAESVNSKNHRNTKAPWYVLPKTPYRNKRATVIGAGLAGTSSAYALAQRGWEVTLIERQANVAQQASGNPQGMLYTKLSPKSGNLNDFSLNSYLYALRFYRQLVTMQQLHQHQYDFCGVLQLVNNSKEHKNFVKLQTLLSMHPQLVQYVDAKQASNISAITIDHPAYFFPTAGWISPPQLCWQLSRHKQINTVLHNEVITLHQHTAEQSITQSQQPVWQLYNQHHQLLSQADVVIIANSVDALRFTQSHHLPLRAIRGQISEIPADGALSKLKTVVCYDGYITPAINGKNTIGATFDLDDHSTCEKVHDHQRNIDRLFQTMPLLLPEAPNNFTVSAITGRAGLRCTSPDYLPVVGQLPDYQAFISDYARLRKDAGWPITTPGRYHTGLYINVGHGSKGLTSTPLCSELLAAIINNEPLPLPRHLTKALSPARFLIRNLIRNKI